MQNSVNSVSQFRNEKATWCRNASRNCFWDGYWGRAGQLLTGFIPYSYKQYQKSLRKLTRLSFFKVVNLDFIKRLHNICGNS